ncbi:MAG: sterol desaturase family protein [Erythrobacter sp.]|uniref:sterol desaturase family protein n=1 Tax=Erythrobacter sp. TaxID=1042 RepID=UPI0025D44B4A|nr:sterol desaturase family protein [Erythrobacter sp.]MCL9998935.1 sterol desaturase family protein [Erythrobacter sp.]
MSQEFLQSLGPHWVLLTLGDVIRYAVFATGMWWLLWVALKRPLARRQIRTNRPPARQLRREFLYSLRSIMVFATISLLPSIAHHLGWWEGDDIAESWGTGWFWASLILMILAHDAYFYWAHRLAHRKGLFAWVHRRHHLSKNPSPFTAYSFDLAEAALMGAFVPLWVLIVPTDWVVVDLFVMHQIVRNTLLHCGIEASPARRDGRPLFDWMTTTTHHDLHHGTVGWNFGLYFTWWDRWMGTEHPEYHRHFAAAVGRPALPATPPASVAV